MTTQDSFNKQLISEQQAQALQQYGVMQSQKGAQKLQELIKKQTSQQEGSEVLSLGGGASLVALQKLASSQPVQTAFEYGKSYYNDYQEGGFDFANKNMVDTIQSRIQAEANKLVQKAQDAVQDQVDSATDTVNKAVTDVQNKVQDGIDTATDTVNNAVNDAQNAVNDGINTATNTMNDAVDTANSAIDEGLTTANGAIGDGLDAVDGGIAEGENTVASGLAGGESMLSNGLNNVASLGENVGSSLSNLQNAGSSLFSNLTSQGQTNSFSNLFGGSTARAPATRIATPALDDEFGTDSLMQDTSTDPISSSVTNNVAGDVAGDVGADVAGDTGVGLLETIAGAADATGIGSVLGVPLALGGLLYSLIDGLKDMFDPSDDSEPVFNPDANDGDVSQAGTS